MRKMETSMPATGRDIRTLGGHELDAVSGADAKAGGDKVKYLEIKLVEVQISSYQL